MTSDLKTQFLNQMTLQRFSNYTKTNYLRGVEGLAQFYHQSPDTLTNDQIQEYLRYLLEDRKLAWGSCNNYFSGIIFFYRKVCKWDETRFQLPPRPRIKKLPRYLQHGRGTKALCCSEERQTPGFTENHL